MLPEVPSNSQLTRGETKTQEQCPYLCTPSSAQVMKESIKLTPDVPGICPRD